MLIPIQTARTAAAPAEDTSAKAQQHPVALLPANQRGEAIQKILDALTRHLAGREILSKDALVRLMEDLARILKFPPLPQEGGRDFVRRLVAFLESMPASDRLLLERQLGGRSLALRVGLLAELPAIRNGATTSPGAATAMPAEARDVILRNPSLQPAMPLNPAAARAQAPGEVALLQAVLRKTFSVGNDPDVIETHGDDMEQPEAADALSQSRTEKPGRNETRAVAGKLASPDGAPIDSAASLFAGEGEIEETTPETALRSEADEGTPSADTGHIEAEPSASDGSRAPIEAETADQMESAETVEDRDPDGTYGPLPDTDEEDGRKVTAAAGRDSPEARPIRVLSDAIKTLIRDSVALPGAATDVDTKPMAGDAEEPGAPLPAPTEEATPTRETDAAGHRRKVADGGNMAPSLPDDQAEHTRAAQRVPADIRSQRPADEQTMQQVIARLVENGLPREAIPFTMIPYPPAANDAAAETEELRREMHGETGEDSSGEEQGAEEGDDRDQQGRESTGEASPEDETPEAPDAYDLYRKLAGLG